ncbi:MAG: TRAP transporter small permease [Aminivibrio sp.]|mgnify:FL=1|jgi:TRAP-type C4-dicarboxylate transport system permease small subunit|nr:TRAP transporter small permease [Aminivibrio sp.]
MEMKLLTGAFRFIHLTLVAFAKLLLLAMVVLIFSNVFMRYILNSGIPWSEEVSIVIVVWFTFISLALGVKHRLHISLCLLPERISPRTDFLLAKITDLVTLFLGYIMIRYGWILVQFTSRSILPATEFPASVMYFPLVLSGILVAYEGFMNLFGLDKGDAGLDERLSGGRCVSDA